MPSATDSEEKSEETKIESLLNNIPDLNKYFNVHKEVGQGTFSTVFMGTLKSQESTSSKNKKKFAIKYIVPTCHPQRIRLELKCLKTIGGVNNVAGIDLCLRNNDNIVFIMPYIHHESFENYYNKMDASELSCYMKNLLIAVAQVHKFGIIHRDIKPSNFLYDRKRKQYLLVDFGLAQVHKPSCSTPKNENNDISRKRKRSIEKDTSPLQQINKGDIQETNELVLPPAKKPNLIFKTPTRIGKVNYQSVTLPNNSDQENMPGNCSGIKENKELMQKTLGRSSLNKQLNRPTVHNKQCNCYGKSRFCEVCLTKDSLVATRTGTPGYRPPEVLLKVSNQTTAVDIWAVGIIFLSLLSHTFSFFNSPDDITALAEMTTVFGIDKMKKIAHYFNRHLICSENLPGVKLEELCNSLRNRSNKKNLKKIMEYPSTAYELLEKLLDLNPDTRITAEKALSLDAFLN